METMPMIHLLSFQETINKQGEKIRILMKENAKLQIVVIENERLKKITIKLEDEVRKCKKTSSETKIVCGQRKM